MRLCEILGVDRVLIDADGSLVTGKAEALREIARLVAPALGLEAAHVEALLMERERLQSTGIGDGVAIPHTAVGEAETQAGALILSRRGLDFDAIDGGKVKIIFGVVGPKRATGEHLRTLARISRLLRDPATRERLLAVDTSAAAFQMIEAHDASVEVKT